MLRRVAIWAAVVLVVAFVGGVIVARVFFNGERLARFIEHQINSRVRGRVAVSRVEWPIGDAHKALLGGWMHATLYDVKVWDSQGDLVIDIPKATTEFRTNRLLFGGDFHFRNLYVPGGYAMIREGHEPYPTTDDDLTVVTLVAAFYPPVRPPGPSHPESRKSGATWNLESIRIENVDADFEFPTFRAHVDDAKGSGWLHYAKPAGDPRTNKFFSFAFSDATAPSGELEIYGLAPFGLVDVHVPTATKVGPPGTPRERDFASDIAWRAAATTAQGTALLVDGRMVDFWQNPTGGDYDITLDIDKLGPLASFLTGGVAHGEHMRATVRVTENRKDPLIRVDVHDAVVGGEVAVGRPPVDAAIPHAALLYRRLARTGELLETTITAGGGEARLTASFGLEPELSFDVELAVPRPIQVGPWLDRETTRMAGGSRVRGNLHVHSLPDGGIRLERVDMTLGDTRARGALTYRDSGLIEADSFRVDASGVWVTAHGGSVDLTERTLDIALAFGAENLRPWLRRLDQPAFARSANGKARITGSLDDPTVPDASVTVHGLPLIGTATSRFRYGGGVLDIQRATSHPFGGSLTGEARIRVKGPVPSILEARVGGIGFDLGRTPGTGGTLAGEARVTASAKGPLRAPESTFVVEVDDLQVAGDDYRNFLLNGSTDVDGSSTLQLHVDRERGGRLDVNGSVTGGGEVGGSVSVREIPVHNLPVILTDDTGKAVFGGVANAELLLSGTVEAPTADGYVSVMRSWFKDAFLGAAELSIERIDKGRVGVTGRMFQGKFTVAGELQTWPSLAAHLTVGFRRIELDQFFPELAEEYGLRGWMSGQFENLALAPGKTPTFQLRLSELVVLMENEDERGRPNPIKARALDEVVIAFDGTTAQLMQQVRFAGPTGEFTLGGSASEHALAISIAGDVSVELLQPYLRDVFEEATGSIETNVAITGPPATPRIVGTMLFSDIRMRPRGQDAEVRLDNAKVELRNDLLSFTGFSIDVIDEITDATDRLEISGNVVLADFQPVQWSLSIDGTLAGKLMLIAAPDTFTAASGSAAVEITLDGTGAMPEITGTLAFEDDRPLTFTPRGLRREILLDRGEVGFDARQIELLAIGGTIDDSGSLTNLSGELSLEDWQPVDVDVELAARALPFRIPRVLELELDVRSFRIVGDLEGLEIGGELDIIDGRYIQKFNPILNALTPERVQETEKPFYEEIPYLANAELALTVTTGGGFGIKNNIANIDLDGTVEVRGSPKRPTFDGEIQVKQGSFKFQGMRSQFERTEGNIVFSRFERFPDFTPSISIRSESDYRDSRGNQHDVVLELNGTITNLNWDLYTTNTSLNKSQTFTLLFSGRTTEENRTLLGDDPVAPTDFDGSRSTASTEGQLDAFDQLAKDYLGDFISVLVEEPLRNATGFDIVRIEVGTSGIGGRIEEDIGKNTKFITEFERTLNGQSFSARGEHRFTDRLSGEVEYLVKEFFDDTDDDTNAVRLKAVYRRIWQ